MGNPEIVDAVVRSKNTAYLFARGMGQTNIFFFDKGGQQILNLDLEVAVDMIALAASPAEKHPRHENNR